MLLGKNTKIYKFFMIWTILNFNIWEVCYPKFDFLICVSYRSQSHGHEIQEIEICSLFCMEITTTL